MGHGTKVSCAYDAELMLCMLLESFTVVLYIFFMSVQQKRFENVACNRQKIKNSTFSCCMQYFCCMKQIFLSVAPWSYSIKYFHEAQPLLANRKTCLKRSIPERMFDFNNVHKQFFFQKQHGARKIRETSINYKHPMLWNNADSNYRNNVKISLIKVKLLTLFAGEFLEEFLGKCFHSLRTSVTREMKKSANGNESKLSFKQKRIYGGHPLTNW